MSFHGELEQTYITGWSAIFTELRGYVNEAVRDGGVIEPRNLLAYMDELTCKHLTDPANRAVERWTEASLDRMADGGAS